MPYDGLMDETLAVARRDKKSWHFYECSSGFLAYFEMPSYLLCTIDCLHNFPLEA